MAFTAGVSPGVAISMHHKVIPTNNISLWWLQGWEVGVDGGNPRGQVASPLSPFCPLKLGPLMVQLSSNLSSIFIGVSFCDFGSCIGRFAVSFSFFLFISFAYFFIIGFGEFVDCNVAPVRLWRFLVYIYF